MPDSELHERLRALPSVEQLLQTEPLRSTAAGAPHLVAVRVARAEIEACRAGAHDGVAVPPVEEIAAAASAELKRSLEPSLVRVINATGVIVHTNLGRAPLAADALAAVQAAGHGYSNLEYDLEDGSRGNRHDHVETLICDLTGAEAAFAVNNNAGAVFLALAAFARGREVIISRGQLVEIGGSFRIPDIMSSSGTRLIEVGTTNRTRIDDYERAITEQTAALMRVHSSNFRTLGFTEEVPVAELCALARRRDLRVIDDLGSGVLGHGDAVDSLQAALADEPAARDSIRAGADVVCFSGDKLLGGPQAGIVAGRAEAVDRMRRHPLARALRIDKLSLAALEATLRLHREPERAVRELPVLRMLSAPEPELSGRAARIRDAILGAGAAAEVEIARAAGRAGGGALPLFELEGPVVSVRPARGGAEQLQRTLREGRPPVVARVHDAALVLDPRTMNDDDAARAAAAVAAALA